MSAMKIGIPGMMFNAEASTARFLLSGAAITLDGTLATVTLASHLFTTAGQQVTFSGCTGVTGLNDQTWTINAVTSTSVYTFPCALTGTVTGTIVQEPVVTLPIGTNFIVTGANAIVQYNPDNKFNAVNASGETWRTVVAASSAGMVVSDGNAVRLRCNGTTATTYYSTVE